MSQQNRKCLECGESLANMHFNKKYCSNYCINKQRYKKFGQRSTSCERQEWYKKRMLNNGYRSRLNQQAVQRYRYVQEYIRSYKISSGCADCGYNKHHAALEFDHILGNKEINVCNAKSISQARLEIDKCEVVCSNCHKIRTFDRLQQTI